MDDLRFLSLRRTPKSNQQDGASSSGMAYRPSRYEQVMKAADGLDTRARKLWGGMGVYTGEKMFAILVDDLVGLKLSPEDRQQALNLGGNPTFKPGPDAPEMSDYVQIPRSILDDPDQFKDWILRSANWVQAKNGTVN